MKKQNVEQMVWIVVAIVNAANKICRKAVVGAKMLKAVESKGVLEAIEDLKKAE